MTVQVFNTTISDCARTVARTRPRSSELAFDSSTIGLRSPASKVLYVETGHGSIVTRLKQNPNAVIRETRLFCDVAAS